jgi:hypothetical protein
MFKVNSYCAAALAIGTLLPRSHSSIRCPPGAVSLSLSRRIRS